MKKRVDYKVIALHKSHIELVKRWLQASHVAKWFPDFKAELSCITSPPEGMTHAVICTGQLPLGYIRWQLVQKNDLDEIGLKNVPVPAVDVDLFVGEKSFLGRGAGAYALKWLERELYEGDNCIKCIGLTTSVKNTKAHDAFKRAGFSYSQSYSTDSYGDCCLFLKKI